jgi:spermidine synthase
MSPVRFKVELIPDALRDGGWWLLVGGSEQSFVDTKHPDHLEFEYVQMIAEVLESSYDAGSPLTALHLGGGLCTVPRWLADRNPGSKQRVAEHSAEIAGLYASLGEPDGIKVELVDAQEMLAKAKQRSVDVLVCDVYDGPDTVTDLFTLDALGMARSKLRRDGVYLCNLSDATPFALSKVVAAGIRETFASVVLLAEPPVLRGRRSGNLVLAGSNRDLPIAEITRRAAGGVVRARVVAGDALDEFIGDAVAAAHELPMSGESLLG